MDFFLIDKWAIQLFSLFEVFYHADRADFFHLRLMGYREHIVKNELDVLNMRPWIAKRVISLIFLSMCNIHFPSTVPVANLNFLEKKIITKVVRSFPSHEYLNHMLTGLLLLL